MSKLVKIGHFFIIEKNNFLYFVSFIYEKKLTPIPFFVKKMFRNIVFHFLKKLIICPTGLCQKKKHAKNIEQIALI